MKETLFMNSDFMADGADRSQIRPPPLENDEIDLLELFRTIWRGKIWIALITAAAVFVGGYYAYRVAIPTYTAHASVVLDSRQAEFVDLGSVMSGLSGDQATINTEIEVLKSRGLIEKLVRRMDLTSDPEFNTALQPEPVVSVSKVRDLIFGAPEKHVPSDQESLDATISTVLKAVTVSNVRNSYVFTITAVTTSPTKSSKIANALADLYILDQLDVKFEATQRATSWLSERVPALQQDLEVAEAAVKELSSHTKLVSPEALEALNRQIKDTRDRLANLKRALTEQQARLRALTSGQAAQDREGMAAIANDTVLNEIVISQGTDVAFDARVTQILQRAQLEVDRTTAQVRSLTQSIVQLEDNYQIQSKDLLQLQQLQREAEASRLIYEYFLGRLKETSVQEGIQQADSRVLSKAAVPGIASAPRKPRILALSAILGLMLGAGLMLLREMLHNGFRTAEDLERITGYTVLGQIPRVPMRKRESVIRYLADKPTSAAAEAVRNLRTSVLLANLDSPPQVIMVTSSIPGEGKTTTSIALAQNFAGLGKKVLLIEGDIRRRVFNEYFNLHGKNGLISVVSGETSIEDAVHHVDMLGADVMIGEKSTINAADLFSSRRFHKFVEEVRKKYDIVIIDTAPVLVVPDSRIIAQVADAVVYGVKWDSTSRNQVQDGLRQFETGGIRVSGIALGQIDPKGMKRYGYGGRNGAYAAYGSDYYDV